VKALPVAVLSLRRALAERAPVVGRVLLYVALLVVFSRLWIVVDPRAHGLAFASAMAVWYLAITELVVLSIPWLHQSVEDDVRTGDVAYRIARPMSYLTLRLSEGVGEYAARFALLLVVGLAIVPALAGRGPGDPRALATALALAFTGGLLLVALQLLVGYCAFWMQEAAPLHWIAQKFTFVFGGLLFPLDIYPDVLQPIAKATPFAAALYGPARLLLHFDAGLALSTLAAQLVWGAGLFGILVVVHRRAVRSIEVGGG
jgi:ABC-2 type transport system permease protein